MTEQERKAKFVVALILTALFCFGVGWLIHGFFSGDVLELCIGGFTAVIANQHAHHGWVHDKLNGRLIL
jgi:hypothetical protein